MNTTTSSDDDQEKGGGTKKQASKRRKRQRDDLFNQTFLSSRAGSLSLTNRIPFPTKLFQMLEDLEQAGQKSIASWSSDGKSFRVHDSKTFVDRVMPHYFRQSKFKSFQRQLHLYGFTRITDGLHKGSYFHSAFLRSNRELSKDMMPLKRVKRDDDQEDSQPEAPSLSSRRSQDEHANQADDEGSRGSPLEGRKNVLKKKQKNASSSSGGAAAASLDYKQTKAAAPQTRPLNDNIQEPHYHEKSPLMYFPPENQLLGSTLAPFSHLRGPSTLPPGGEVLSRPIAQQATLQPPDQPLPHESRMIAYNSSLSSDEDGKKTTVERTSEGGDNNNMNIVSAHQDQQQRYQHQRVSLLPDPSNPSGMVALENQFYPPLDRLIALPEVSRRISRGATPQMDPSTSSTSFLPQLATRNTSAQPSSDSHSIPIYPTEPHLQRTVMSAPSSRRASYTQSSSVENKQQEPLESAPSPSPLLTVLQQLPSRSSLLDEVYREQAFHTSQRQDERGFVQLMMNQQPLQPQHGTSQLDIPLQPVVNAPTGGQPFNNVPTTNNTAVTNMFLAFQQQMNESYLLALLQQQQQQQQILAQQQAGEASRQIPRNDDVGGSHGPVTRTSPTSAFSTVLPYHTSLVQQINQASNHGERSTTNPAAPLVPSSVTLFNFQDPPPPTMTTSSRPNSAGSNSFLVAPPPFRFPTPAEQHHRRPSASGSATTGSASIMMGSNTLLPVDHSSRMMTNSSFHHGHSSQNNDDEERLCLPPPPPPAPPPRRQSDESGQQQARVEEVPSNSHHHEVEGTTSQQQHRHHQNERTGYRGGGGAQRGPRRESSQHQQEATSNDQQQDVSPANSGTSFDSSLFEPNPFYQ